MDEALPLGRLALLLFMLMGPIGLIPAFDGAMRGRDGKDRLRVALQVTVFALLALVLAVFLGTAAMARVGTTPPSLIIAAGTILAVTAMRNILAAGQPPTAPPPATTPGALPRWMPALSPIAIPGLISPVVVAILVIFASSFPAPAERFTILGVALAIMALNLIAMLCANAFMRRIGVAPLLLLGAVFGVLQVALGIEILSDGVALAIAQRSGV
jgi:multiple antibiotic resistance protein